MKQKKTKNKHSEAAKSVNKWLGISAAIIAIGGVFGFGLIAYIANIKSGNKDYDPLWMIYMIPFMLVITVPITILIARSIYKNFDKLSAAMNDVANGETNVYIPTAKPTAFTGIYKDFNKMAAEIAGIQRLRTAMVDGFSHEIKTPIASINGFAKMLLEEDLTEEKRRKYLEIIVKESERLAAFSKDNLFLSKIDAQEIIIKEPYNLGSQIQDIAISLEKMWSEKDINLTAELPEVIYKGDANLMASLWTNLLSNAIKYTPKKGEITITLTETKKDIRTSRSAQEPCASVVVTFTDTGIGMSEEILEKIFERYFQGDTSRSSEGNGLGLSIVKRIVRLCGGRIAVQSKEGEGSTFTVTLPKE